MSTPAAPTSRTAVGRGAEAAADRATRRLAAVLPGLQETRRAMARLAALEARLLARADGIAHEWAAADPSSAAELPYRSVAAEIASEWRVSDRTVQRQLGDAATLVEDYPATLEALGSGDISPAHVRVILAAGAVISDSSSRAAFEESVLEYAKAESATRLAPVAKLRAERFAAETVTERHIRARAERRVWVEDLDDGMAMLGAILPAVLAHGAHERLTQMARALDGVDAGEETGSPAPAEAHDPRRLDERRADILSDLLLAASPTACGDTGLSAVTAAVQIVVPVLSLLNDDDSSAPALLDGHGPIDLDTARHLAGAASGWDRVLTHPISGAVLAVDRYRPSEELRRHLRVRDRHCRFPGCRMATTRCDLDHTVDHALDGPTESENLAHLCRRHHVLKHQTPWTVRQRESGVLEWTSPSGRRYVDRPTGAVTFAVPPDTSPPPF